MIQLVKISSDVTRVLRIDGQVSTWVRRVSLKEANCPVCYRMVHRRDRVWAPVNRRHDLRRIHERCLP
jgi:hypothetical protein